MQERKWTFLLVTDEKAPVRQVSVRSRTARWVAALAACAFVLLFGVVLFAGSRAASSARAVHLERQNDLLEEELHDVRSQLARLEGNLADLAERDRQLRVIAGLDSLDHEVLEVGIGGPGAPDLESHPLRELDPDLGDETFALRYDLEAMERRAGLLLESMKEAGDSLAAHRDLLESTPSILPTSGYLSSGFSNARMHPVHNRALPHEGVDIAARPGTPILAAANGRVTFAGRRSGYGLVVEVDHGYGYVTLYGHASEVLVRRGQQVERGEAIAKIGRTGIATSPHLHYEVRVGDRPVNPMNYVITGAIP